jgi:GT2 family glycosyltransferase
VVSGRLPLASLRPRLDATSERLRWTVNPDGVYGRVLILREGTAATFPLALAGSVTFTGRAMLLPHDWRDREGVARVSVQITEADGHRRELFAETLAASDRGEPRGHRAELHLPANTTALTLGVDVRDARDPHPLRRAIWVEPGITDTAARPLAVPLPASAAPAGDPPLISVLVPVHDPDPRMLEEAVDSVRSQSYARWELCLVDDGSRQPEIIASLERYAADDPRIHLTRHDRALGIAGATNAALERASGQFVALLDHDDALTHDALQRIAGTIAADPGLDMIYSDEEIILNGRRVWGHFKPDWSPDTLRTNGYTCHLGVYRRALVHEIGGFRSEYNGSQDVDMILRLVEHTDRIAHVPDILYRWRVHAGSTASGSQAKPYAYVAARNAIAAHLVRIGVDGEVGFGPPGLYRLAHRVDPSLTVELVLAVTETTGLAEAAASWRDQPHHAWRVVLGAPEAIAGAALDAFASAGVPCERVTLIPGADLAGAASSASAEHLVLMQTPAMGLTRDWLTRLIGYSAQDGIAAAGPVLLAPDGRILQAGIALPDGIPLHLLHGTRSSMDKLFGYGTSVFNVSAVSGLLCTSRATYEQLGGLQPQHRELALIDYCLRAGDTGQRTVIVPDSRLRAVGPDTTTNDLPAIWRLRAQWAATHTHDPYYNPNYRTDRGDFVPAVT